MIVVNKDQKAESDKVSSSYIIKDLSGHRKELGFYLNMRGIICMVLMN